MANEYFTITTNGVFYIVVARIAKLWRAMTTQKGFEMTD
jgi:hypothetical protein